MSSGSVKVEVKSVSDIFYVSDKDGDGYLSKGDVIAARNDAVVPGSDGYSSAGEGAELDQSIFWHGKPSSVRSLSKLADAIETATGREVSVVFGRGHSREVSLVISAENDSETVARQVAVGTRTSAGKGSLHYSDKTDKIQ